MSDVTPVLEAAVRTATPLLIAAVGETISERAGVINIALEGCIIAGAYAAFVAASANPVVGYSASVVAGLSLGVLLAIVAVGLRRDQIIVGTALTMLALGLTGTLFRARGNEAAVVVLTEPATVVPLLSIIPVVGPAFFVQPAIAYVAVALAAGVWWWLRRTHGGLALRAVGDSPASARAAGIHIARVQTLAVLFGSALGGLAGGSLVLAQAGSFAEGMSAGRGFLAIAIVALGRWRPVGVAVASLVFGAAMGLQFVVQALGWRVRYELVLMVPYALTLIALSLFGKGAAPAMLGRAVLDD
jgi:simple sugar transport system permease protein